MRTESQSLVTDDVEARLRAFARLLVRTGVNLSEGQELLVHGQHEHAPFVRAIAQEAYAAGARFVDVAYADRWVQRAFVESAPDEMLGWTPPWMVAAAGARDRGRRRHHRRLGRLGRRGLRGPRRRTARARSFRDFDRVWMEGIMGRKLAWSLVAFPTEGWAREALGEPDVDRLWDAFAHALRLDEPDPSAAWAARLDQLQARARELTARGFTALRYRGPGTDLEVGLIEGARWLAGRERTVHGQVHAPNLPTEEVFTSPHRERAEGTIRSTMPLALRGTIVEGLELRARGRRDRRGPRQPRRGRRCAPSSPSTTARAASARSRWWTPPRASARPASSSTTRSSTRTPRPTSPGATRCPGPWTMSRPSQHAGGGPQPVRHPHGLHGRLAGGRDRRGGGRAARPWRCCARGLAAEASSAPRLRLRGELPADGGEASNSGGRGGGPVWRAR